MPHSKRLLTAIVSACALPALLSACGAGDGSSAAPRPPTATGVTTGTPDAPGPSGATAGARETPGPSGTGQPGTARPTRTAPPAGTARPTAGGARCHTSQLSASVGRGNPGAGQRNFPVVLTNTSSRTCTLYGYPGAAFVDLAGRQLGPDPRREAGPVPATVTLAPGRSAWAGLRFTSPEISGARTAAPAALLVTPPDERDPLKVPWTAGEVPVGGNGSSVLLTVFSPGSGG
jgi:hypothetical protein